MIANNVAATVQQYIDSVLDGTIPTCKLVRLAVERHVNDLERQSTTEFPYHFDAKHATKMCTFYPTFLRHSIGNHQGMPFELEPWQMFGEWCLFGWKRDCDNTRRFRRIYESVARKNGKSTRQAGRSILMGMADKNPNTNQFEAVAQIILCATKKEQAEKVIYEEVQRMRQASHDIFKRSTNVKNVVRFTKNNGSILCVGSDKPFDGLNPHMVAMDELHAWREYHREFYNTMVTGSGARAQPLISMTTTAGDDKSFLWLEIYNYGKEILLGNVQDESYLNLCYELDDDDDPLDPANWIKANPNLGVSVQLDYLKQQAIEAKTSAVALNRFIRYHGNRIVSSLESAFNLTEWDLCSTELSDWKDADCVTAAIDLGGRDDLAAYALCARFPIGDGTQHRYEIKAQGYIATSTERDLTKQPFADFVYRGMVKSCQYPVAQLKADIIEQCQTFNVQKVAFDPYNGQQISEELEQQGMIAARMAQNQANFNEPITEFAKAIREGRLSHGGSKLLRWAASNAVISRDRQDRWMYDKKASSDKIDPIVAATMAFRLATLEPARASGPLFII